MVESEREGAVDRQGAAEPHAAIHRKTCPALQQEPDDLQEILVPAHRDAVFGDPAEPGHDAVVEPFDKARDIAYRPKRTAAAIEGDAADLRRKRLDLEPINRGDEMAVVQQMMREGKTGGTQPDDE